MLESSYYSSEDKNIPSHIHDIFQNGLPADFRLVGATTRLPEHIPPAIRSRCLEVFFRGLTPDEVATIARNGAVKAGFKIAETAVDVIAKYATNGREAVNIVQIAAGLAQTQIRINIEKEDIEWVINSGQYSPRPEKKIHTTPQVGLVNGLAVYGPNMGMLMELEASVIPAAKGQGKIIVTGVVEEEEMGYGDGKKVRRKSMAKGSVENVLTILRRHLGVDPRNYDIHVNFPGGIPVDGPSAGVTVATAIYSAISERPVDNQVAMTGEVSIRGEVRPVGGIVAKVEAARQAGVKRVYIPKDNWQGIFARLTDIKVIPIAFLEEVIQGSLVDKTAIAVSEGVRLNADLLSACVNPTVQVKTQH